MDIRVRSDVFQRFQKGVPQALLFRGKAGVGKFLTARAIADYHSVDLYIEVFRGSISVDKIRMVSAKCLVSTFGNSPRFMLLETDELSEPASNALLRILEAPKPNVHFILIQTNKPVLSTIKSRCQVVDFVSYGNTQLRDILIECGVSSEVVGRVIGKAQGSLVKAGEAIEHISERETFLDAIRYLSEGKLSLFIKKLKKPTDYQSDLLLIWLSELYALKMLGVEGVQFGNNFFGFDKMAKEEIVALRGKCLVNIKPSLRFLLLSQVLVRK